jgi:hypothetical protein
VDAEYDARRAALAQPTRRISGFPADCADGYEFAGFD